MAQPASRTPIRETNYNLGSKARTGMGSKDLKRKGSGSPNGGYAKWNGKGGSK